MADYGTTRKCLRARGADGAALEQVGREAVAQPSGGMSGSPTRTPLH